MADIVKNSRHLIIDTAFVDGDSRSFSIKNPRSDISRSEIEDLNAYIQQTGILIGDKDGATFGRIKKVTLRETTTAYLDLSDD